MKAVGIIAEYNPFHNGHLWQVEQARKKSGCDAVIAVMSGNFLQRGEPAAFDKWLRAEMAVRGGVDLVFELPSVFAVRSAQFFAAGGVRLLAALGVVSHLSFGAETADLKVLGAAASAMMQDRTLQTLRGHMKTGIPYAKALCLSVTEATGIDEATLSSPNNILAIEYLKAINTYAPALVPIPVARRQSQYHDTEIVANIASATAIRRTLETEQRITGAIARAVPATTLNIIKKALASGQGPSRWSRLSPLILYLLRTLPCETMEKTPDAGEGLHYKLAECAMRASDVDELLELVKSKRYTRTRLQRILIHLLLGTQKEELASWDEAGPLYARTLAFNERGRVLLKEIAQSTSLPLVAKTTKVLDSRRRNRCELSSFERMLAIDTLAGDIFGFTLANSRWHAGGQDFLRSPSYIPFPQEGV
ncbi:MAG: nucleotidyltransferase [Negativicutes bacterium]|nr:nucleotidyltransferase [Negativicutes bacterium]